VRLFLTLALRNVFRNRARTTVALSAIGFGCAALIVNGGIIYDIFEELREDAIRGRHGHLQIYRGGYSEHHLREPGRYLIPHEEADRVVRLLASQPHVEHVTRRREFSGMISSKDRYVAFVGIGVEPALEGEYSRHTLLRRGEPLSADVPYGMIAGLGLAEKFGGEPGDLVTLMTNTDTGALNAVDARLMGVFEGGMKAYDDWTLKIPLEAVERLLLDDRTEVLVVLLDSTDRVDEVRASLADLFAREGLDLETRSWQDLALFHNQVVGLFQRELDVIKVIIATIVILGIANTIGISILERRAELATLRALGLRRSAIIRLLLAETALAGVIGGLLGVGLGYAATRLITAIGIPFPSPPGSTKPFLGSADFVPSLAAGSFLLLAAATLIAAAPIIWKASRRPIAETLRAG
jgi:putative ABC transport system permease protein